MTDIHFNPIAAGYGAGAVNLPSQGSSKKVAGNQDKPLYSPGEQVELSGTSGELQGLRDFVRRLPSVRIDRVEEIREQIKANNYPLENRLTKAVDKMVDLELV